MRTPSMPEEFTIPVGVGYVSTKKYWQYGWFEAWIQLPEGQSYWPAFWLTGQNGWPPEIDILEAYSQNGPKYEERSLFGIGKKIPYQKIQPNIHYGKTEDGTKKDYGSYDIPVAKCTERFVQYVCHWEENFIKIHYDGILVLEITDQKILKSFNGDNDQMYVIFNHGLHQDFPGNPQESSMIIKSFRVLQKLRG
jgi:beta-glucanase (GH16 family)